MLISSRLARRAFAAVALATLASAAPCAAQPVTLEALLGSPFPSALVAAPAGGHVAWVQNAAGARSIWVASPPDFRARQLTAFSGDDGQELGSLTWTPDGATLFFVRGGGPNRQGEYPNPTSDPAGVEQTIWRVPLAGGEPVRVAAGAAPAVSPRGDGIAFLRRGQVFWAPLAGGGEPRQLIRARGTAGSLRWSPDGARLAFVSSRGLHSFIGVYDVGARSIRWLAPSVDRDGHPAWSPDGRRIAFIRIPASTETMIFRARRSAQPWSIHVADVATGRATSIWRAEEGRGSLFWPVVAANQLLWGAGDRLVFPWERSGWLNLYSLPAGGGTPTPLTPGAFEVEFVTLSADGRYAIYNSNQGDIDRRDLWQVAVTGGRPLQLTSGSSIEWEPAPTSDGRAIAFLRSDARTPAHPAILPAGGQPRDLAPGSLPAGFPLRSLVEPRAVTYSAADGMQIPAQLFLPPDLRAGERRPAVIYIHGGSRRQMLLGWHYTSYYHHAYAMNQYLASRGYVVLSINFRSGTGYGMEFREALYYGAGGASEFNDVVGAGLYLRSRPDVDPSRIGLWGGSYGGYLTALGLARASDLFAAGVDIHGVHDWNVGIRTFIPAYNPLERPDEARIAFQASPMAHLDTWRSPVLVIHGDDDRNVAFAETVALVEGLRERNVHVEQLVFPDEVHNFLVHQRWLETFRATADFLDRHLGARR
jgi:dipeptidyl aminopeptidase/acylaminoacyl peptidase